MTESSQLIRGLEGVVAAETRLCDLDGKQGRLAYGGYDIEDLARRATFEEVCYLLWHGELPTRAQLDRFQVELAAVRTIPDELVRLSREHSIDILVMGGHRHRGLKDVLHGATISKVRHALPIPVLIIQ